MVLASVWCLWLWLWTWTSSSCLLVEGRPPSPPPQLTFSYFTLFWRHSGNRLDPCCTMADIVLLFPIRFIFSMRLWAAAHFLIWADWLVHFLLLVLMDWASSPSGHFMLWHRLLLCFVSSPHIQVFIQDGGRDLWDYYDWKLIFYLLRFIVFIISCCQTSADTHTHTQTHSLTQVFRFYISQQHSSIRFMPHTRLGNVSHWLSSLETHTEKNGIVWVLI